MYPVHQGAASSMYPNSVPGVAVFATKQNFASASSNGFMEAPVRQGIEVASEAARADKLQQILAAKK